MIKPPATELSAWCPNHWITESGYALTEDDVKLGCQRDLPRAVRMMKDAKTVTDVMQEVMAK